MKKNIRFKPVSFSVERLLLFKMKLLVIFSVFGLSVNASVLPTIKLTGIVRDETGIPIPDVILTSKMQSTVRGFTDKDGRFVISVANQNDTLVFYHIGFQTTEIPLHSKDSIIVVMYHTVNLLNEVVINGYGTQRWEMITGSVSHVKSNELGNRSYTSFDQTLQGLATGIQSVGSSGQPGALQEIRIRGIGSITASAEPLYVVDGIIINSGELSTYTTTSNSLSTINPNDIENINILKDASASAIYGSRAANGVIIITTKQGKAGNTRVGFNTGYGYAAYGNAPQAGNLLNTAQWRIITANGLLNNPVVVSENQLTKENILAYVDRTFGTDKGVDTNWPDLVRRRGREEQYNLSLNGGNDNTQFYISGGYFRQQGTVIASDFNRYSVNFSINTRVNKRTTLSGKVLIAESGQHSPDGGSLPSNPVSAAVHLLPFISPYNADGSYNIDPATFPSNEYNPLYIAANNSAILHQLKSLGSVEAGYEMNKNLKFTSRLGIDYNNLEEDFYLNPEYGDGAGLKGFSTRNYTRYFNWVWTNLVDYAPDLGAKYLTTHFKAGYEAQKSQYYFVNATSTGLPADPEITVPSNGTTPYAALGSNEDYTIASLLSIADISYKAKYILSGSFRRDGSSRFGSGKRYGNFWSIGAAWNAGEEALFKQLRWIDALKLRISYGITGNANIGNYNWRQLYSYGNNYNGMGGTAPSSIGNPNLTWESNKQLNTGIDVSLMKGRLAFTFDYYNREATNLLLDQPTSLTSGFASFINNVGSMRNRGLELSISGIPIVAGSFKWEAGFGLAHNKNTILSLVEGKDIVSGSFIRRVGLDFQTFYLRQWAGVDPANGSPLWYTDASRTKTTTNYNAAALVANKSASPGVFGSFTSAFTYKDFRVYGMIYFNFDNYIQDFWARYTQSDGANAAYNHFASQLNAWQKPGDITNTPIYIYNNTNNSARQSSRFLYKGDYARLKELTLSYKLPAKALHKLKIEGLELYVRGNNLFTWVRDKNLPYDPEQGITSQANYNIAITKLFTAGANVQF